MPAFCSKRSSVVFSLFQTTPRATLLLLAGGLFLHTTPPAWQIGNGGIFYFFLPLHYVPSCFRNGGWSESRERVCVCAWHKSHSATWWSRRLLYIRPAIDLLPWWPRRLRYLVGTGSVFLSSHTLSRFFLSGRGGEGWKRWESPRCWKRNAVWWRGIREFGDISCQHLNIPPPSPFQ